MERNYTEQYRPLSPWTYFGLNLLFSVPIVGLVFLIVFTFSKGNMNRRAYARSYWCAALVGLILFVLFAAFSAIAGISFQDYAAMIQGAR